MSFGVGIKRKAWSSEEEGLAKELLAQGAPDLLFREKLGRSKAAATTHFYYKAGRRPYEPKCSRTEIADLASARPTADLLVEAARRASASCRDLTAQLMGDPPVGYSELDKRHGSRHSA